MNGSEIIEIGALTASVEMVRLKGELAPLWDDLAESHPLDVVADVTMEEPMVDRIARTVGQIEGIREKGVILLAGPELVALEALEKLGLDAEIIVAVYRGLPDDAVERVARNVPGGLRVKVLRDLPDRHLGPSDAVFLAVGFRGGYRLVLIPSWIAPVVYTYATVFSGERLLIDAAGYPVHWRRSAWSGAPSEPGWVTDRESRFTGIVGPWDSEVPERDASAAQLLSSHAVVRP